MIQEETKIQIIDGQMQIDGIKIKKEGKINMEKYIRIGIGVMILDGNKVLLGHRAKNKKDTGIFSDGCPHGDDCCLRKQKRNS